MKKQNVPVSRKEEIVVQEMDGEVLIYDLKGNKAFCLNETSSLVWQMCDGKKTVSEISASLGEKLNQPANEDLVWLAIDQLKKEKLLANGAELPNNFEGMNRREVIKKIGLASMIALPVIAGMIAPTPAMALSAGQAPGNFSGTASSNGNDCGANGGGINARDMNCNQETMAVCTSMQAESTLNTCNFDAGTNMSTFNCMCV